MWKWLTHSEDAGEIATLEGLISCLKTEKRDLKEQVADLKLKRKIEEEDIKHMVKINAERKDIELEKSTIQLEKEKAREIAEVKDGYRDKTEKQLEKQLTDMKNMYGEILQRLPNYNVNHNVKDAR